MADIFDRDGDGYIDYYEFVAALHPNKDAYKPITDADKIEDEVLIVVPLLQQGHPCLPQGFCEAHITDSQALGPPSPPQSTKVNVNTAPLSLTGHEAGGQV